MLNVKGERELVYIVKIDEILPIEGADNVETAVVGGWRIMVRKNQPGSIAIYFEIDSKVPETEPFMFLAAKHFKVKTQKYFKGKVISQGLLMHPNDFGWNVIDDEKIEDVKNKKIYIVGDFLTKELGVSYAEAEDNQRKANSADKYKVMAQRRPNIFKQPWARWMMKRGWGRKIMFLFFGRKKDKRSAWPAWVQKTEERIQNMPWILNDKSQWVVTEKIDGTSTTATLRKKQFNKYDFYICSRNVVFDKPDKKCFYETNVYTEMAEKYNFEKVLLDICNKYNLEWATIQGETYGAGVQKREYGLKGHDFMAFNLIFSDRGRLNSEEAAMILQKYNIPFVPIVCRTYVLPDTVEELLLYATGKSVIDGGMREGFVFRSKDGQRSFKAVSNEFLLKYHQ